MAVSKAQQRAVSKYMKENYDEIKVRIAKGEKEVIKTHAEAHNELVTSRDGTRRVVSRLRTMCRRFNFLHFFFVKCLQN